MALCDELKFLTGYERLIDSWMVMAKKKTDKSLVPEKFEEQVRKIKLEINTDRAEESIRQAVQKVQYWYRQGMIRKIRLNTKAKRSFPIFRFLILWPCRLRHSS